MRFEKKGVVASIDLVLVVNGVRAIIDSRVNARPKQVIQQSSLISSFTSLNIVRADIPRGV